MKKLTLLALALSIGASAQTTKVPPKQGSGLGIDSSALTGCARITAGVWSASPCGGGSGALFPATPGVVYNTTTTASRNATNTDITLLLGPTLYAQNFSGADAGAKINACNTAAVAAGGGTCDDTAVLTLGATATAEIAIGDVSAGVATVRHIFPAQFALRSTLHDVTKCAVRVYNRGILDGQGLGGGGSRADLFPGAGSTMEGLLCSDVSNVNAQNYVRIWGVSAVNDNGSTMAHVVDLEDLADQSIFAYGYFNNHHQAIRSSSVTSAVEWLLRGFRLLALTSLEPRTLQVERL